MRRPIFDYCDGLYVGVPSTETGKDCLFLGSLTNQRLLARFYPEHGEKITHVSITSEMVVAVTVFGVCRVFDRALRQQAQFRLPNAEFKDVCASGHDIVFAKRGHRLYTWSLSDKKLKELMLEPPLPPSKAYYRIEIRDGQVAVVYIYRTPQTLINEVNEHVQFKRMTLDGTTLSDKQISLRTNQRTPNKPSRDNMRDPIGRFSHIMDYNEFNDKRWALFYDFFKDTFKWVEVESSWNATSWFQNLAPVQYPGICSSMSVRRCSVISKPLTTAACTYCDRTFFIHLDQEDFTVCCFDPSVELAGFQALTEDPLPE